MPTLSAIPVFTRVAFGLGLLAGLTMLLRITLWPESWPLYYATMLLTPAAVICALQAVRIEVRAIRQARQRRDASTDE